MKYLRWHKTRIALYDTKATGFIQAVLVQYVNDAVFICVNQNKFDMKKKKKDKIVTVDMYHTYLKSMKCIPVNRISFDRRLLKDDSSL
ncbi:hypothetical protein [Sphingobacterium corticibacterium]|uniref:Uncharacterized protein n=1 Tax=Sphingobacterium corticibacterium TaxID=2484746 RepID=A0A4Q6XQQ2_9SPHI|nr:hypothetical protein [Sphingobacterium corticibacterium]RZF62085.1 hypothetical protein EWE74_04535 [Sphingobacterium corticibacterium]